MNMLVVGSQIHFVGELLPMIVGAVTENFAVCTRKVDKEVDRDILEFEVTRGAYMNFDIAYERLKDDLIYTCIDFKEGVKGCHNMIFNAWNFEKEKDLIDLCHKLESGEVEISHRTRSRFRIEYNPKININMKTIFVIYTNKKLENPRTQKRYAFNTSSDLKPGDMLDSPSYDTNMQVVEVLDSRYKYFNFKRGDMSNTMNNSNLYEIRELELRANEDKKIYAALITEDNA